MIDIKKDTRYVVAMMDVVPMFLFRNNTGQYAFTDNISVAVKTFDKYTARQVIKQYISQSGDCCSMTILPIEITYKIAED